jgi:hypothetical protein
MKWECKTCHHQFSGSSSECPVCKNKDSWYIGGIWGHYLLVSIGVIIFLVFLYFMWFPACIGFLIFFLILIPISVWLTLKKRKKIGS